MLALAADPDRWRYGYELGVEVGLKSGSLYPILMRLCDRTLVEARWEDALLRQDRVCFGARYHFLTLGTTDLEVIAPIDDDPSRDPAA